jgi:glutamate decarboxylase
VALRHPKGKRDGREEVAVAPLFGLERNAIPRHVVGRRPLPPEVAYQIVHDELMLDGNARLNVATFVTTSMEPHAERLMAECFDKNMIDKDEYPQTAEIEMRCVSILSEPGTAPTARHRPSTTGSSEAAMPGGLAWAPLAAGSCAAAACRQAQSQMG